MLLTLAFGTRGDVQPLTTLAEKLRRDGDEVLVITHRAHGAWLEAFPFDCLKVQYVESEPCVSVAGDGVEEPPACEATSDWAHLVNVWTIVQGLKTKPSLIVFNLFALEVSQNRLCNRLV